MKNLLFFYTLLFFSIIFDSCNKSPKEDLIIEYINNRYSMMGIAAGAGTWDVHQIKITSINKTQKDKE